MPPGDSALLRAAGLSASYGSRVIFSEVNVEIQPGELVGLVGPNGSGKTTLLHTLTGYHPADAGNIELGGSPMAGMSRREVAKRIAFVPQRTEAAFGFMAMEMVLMGRHAYAGYAMQDRAEDVACAMEALEELKIVPLMDRVFAELSGGEQQLVLLARAFAQGAALLMLDEPLTGLDIGHQHHLMQTLSDRVKTGRFGALATFHDLSVASRWCERLILLAAQGIIAEGPPEAVITAENLAAAYKIDAQVLPAGAGRGLHIYLRESSLSSD